MLLQPDPSLAEVPGFSREQLDSLARSVESRRQQLERDIHDYINSKQHELRNHERQLVEHHRSMECVDTGSSAEQNPSRNAENVATAPAVQEQSLPDIDEREPEKAKRTKHTRVHKREQELYGLVTPVFLPLLDARDVSPTSQKERREKKQAKVNDDAYTTSAAEQAASSRHAEKSKEGRKSKKENKDMEGAVFGDPVRQNPQAEAVKKTKRVGAKKSALRHKDTPRSRRKRVSLVIDGQTVLPADTIIEPVLTEPSSGATSASNSTASLDELIDPQLTRQDTYRNAVHHSLPLPMSRSHSPSKPLAETPTTTSVSIQPEYPPHLSSPRSPSILVSPAQTATRSFLDPSPSHIHTTSIPHTAGPGPIYPQSSSDATLETEDLVEEETTEAQWDTYVGGLHGSGVDDVDQAGSYGYPSSLGASYLESYMQSRPLSVRMQAADKAELEGLEKRQMVLGRREHEEDEAPGRDVDEEEFGRARRGEQMDDDDMDITGSMEF